MRDLQLAEFVSRIRRVVRNSITKSLNSRVVLVNLPNNFVSNDLRWESRRLNHPYPTMSPKVHYDNDDQTLGVWCETLDDDLP